MANSKKIPSVAVKVVANSKKKLSVRPPPKQKRVDNRVDDVPLFSVIVVERMFSLKFRIDFWKAMQNLNYLNCDRGRKGSLMRFVTNQQRDISEQWLPIGSEGKIVYYGATKPSVHKAAVINCINYMFRLQCNIFEQAYRLALATPRGRQAKQRLRRQCHPL
jgi:hypothetical protein